MPPGVYNNLSFLKLASTVQQVRLPVYKNKLEKIRVQLTFLVKLNDLYSKYSNTPYLQLQLNKCNILPDKKLEFKYEKPSYTVLVLVSSL